MKKRGVADSFKLVVALGWTAPLVCQVGKIKDRPNYIRNDDPVLVNFPSVPANHQLNVNCFTKKVKEPPSGKKGTFKTEEYVYFFLAENLIKDVLTEEKSRSSRKRLI
jgi:hypothetical protein